MKSLEYYNGKTQTYLKHYFLEKYLERVVYNIISFRDEFIFIDGFSGPWKSTDEKLEDTSFAIAINVLKKIKSHKYSKFHSKSLRCIFNEKVPSSYKELKTYCDTITTIPIIPLNEEFENIATRITEEAKNSFSFIFIDPTGWTGFGLNKIKALFKLHNEILINFMFDHINRFFATKDASLKPSLDILFGGPNWDIEINHMINNGFSTESAILQIYQNRLKSIGGYKYTKAIRILNPLKDRTYFHLIYATQHEKGIIEAAKIEKATFIEQEVVREKTKEQAKTLNSKQEFLFSDFAIPNSKRDKQLTNEQQENISQAKAKIMEQLEESAKPIPYWGVLANAMQVPLVWKEEVDDYLKELMENKIIIVPNFKRAFKKEHTINLKSHT